MCAEKLETILPRNPTGVVAAGRGMVVCDNADDEEMRA